MAAFSIVVTNLIPEAGLALLRGLVPAPDIEVIQRDRPLNRQALAGLVRGRDAILAMVDDPFDRPVVQQCDRARVLALCGVGHNNVDLATCTERGIRVANTPGVLTDATAEMTLALILAVARRVAEGDRFVRAGHFTGWTPTLLLGAGLRGRTLGIVGAGRIGQRVGEMGVAIGMRLIYTSRSPNPAFERTAGALWRALPELLAEADVVSLHVPLSPETRHMIDAAALRRMRPSAMLINTSRGLVVDEAALAEALQAGRLAGAGLDVYEHEPAVDPALLARERVVLLPHLGSATTETRARMAETAAAEIARALRGTEPVNLVNGEVRGRRWPGPRFAAPADDAPGVRPD